MCALYNDGMKTMSYLATWQVLNPKSPFTIISCVDDAFINVHMISVVLRYGDISPRGYIARSIAILWTAVGLIVNGILVSSLSTALTVITVDEQTMLYGANVCNCFMIILPQRLGNQGRTGCFSQQKFT